MIDEGRAFANKLWNASRLVLLGVDPDAVAEPAGAEPVDRWILTRLAETVTEVTGLLEAYQFSAATKALYGFVWNDFCDWYLEAIKVRLYGDDEGGRGAASACALYVLETTLRLLHPVMPFVTEEIWPFLPGDQGLLMQAAYPQASDIPTDPEAGRAVGNVIELVTELRRVRADAGLPPREPLAVAIGGGEDARLLRAQADLLAGLGRASVVDDAGNGVPLVIGDAEVAVGGDGLAAGLRGKIAKRLADAEAELRKAEAKLANASFVERAPAAVVAEERDRAGRFAAEAETLRARLAQLAP
jgi:valyl-tRNA synthetase